MQPPTTSMIVGATDHNLSGHASAELAPRLGARVVDAALLAAVDVALGKTMGFGYGWLVIGTAIVLAYFTLLDTFGGATVGKRLFGLRVIGPDGNRPSLKQSAIREAFTVVGSVPFVGVILAAGAGRGSSFRSGRTHCDRGATMPGPVEPASS
jgi:uncharacterized RDD family membrane protein YckC